MLRSSYHFGDDKCPILACAIHTGHDIRPELLRLTGVPEADRLREEDPYTGTIAELFSNHIILHSSRFETDLNRAPAMAVYQKPEDCWDLPARTGLIPAELLEELQTDYNDWYVILRYQIERLLQFNHKLIILDLHSFNHRRQGPGMPPDPQAQNPDIIIGRNNLPRELYPRIDQLRALLDGKEWSGINLDCRCDVKFSGGNLSRWINYNFSGRVVCLAIEFKKIWMDEWSGTVYEPGFTELKAIFREQTMLWVESLLQQSNSPHPSIEI